jgi:triosephosphate isomerase
VGHYSDVVDRDEVWVGTSWKMTKTLAEATAYAERLAAADLPPGVRVFVLPPLTALATVRACLPPDTPVQLGVQNAHWAPEGAWTGEVSMRQVADAGASLVEIGHSERREHFEETDEVVARKVRAAVDHGLTPLVCFGESGPAREAGRTEELVAGQVRAAVSLLDGAEVAGVVLAYEPVWAIGSGGRPARPAEVDPVLQSVAGTLEELSPYGARPRLLYGGSVTVDNAAELLAGPHTDGLFVGRGAWDVDDLLDLVSICASHVGPPAG